MKSSPGIVEFGGGPTTHHISTLQHLLRAAHSSDVQEQQHAAHQLSVLVESTVFPAVSYGPLIHALCRLVPSENRGVACFSARSVKILLLDDSLRPSAITSGVPAALVGALDRWTAVTDTLCIRELLGGCQTLLWEKSSVGLLVEAGITPILIALLEFRDPDVSVLALSSLANLLAFSDSLLLQKDDVIKQISSIMQTLLELCKSRDMSARCYATSALANASSHPVLAGRISDIGGLEILKDIERTGKANLSIGGTRVAECAETAVMRLTGNKDAKIALRKYSYKWGNTPSLELVLDPQAHRNRFQVFVVIWVLCVVLLFEPLVFSHRKGSREDNQQ